MINRIFLLLIVLIQFSCKTSGVEFFKLKEINLDLVYSDSICVKNTKWISKSFFESEIQKYSKKHTNELFEKLLIAHFTSEGEVVDYNTLILLSFKNGKTKVIHKNGKSTNSIIIDEYSLKNFTSKLKNEENFIFSNQITLMEFKRGGFTCYFNDSYNDLVFESLKNLSFFNKK